MKVKYLLSKEHSKKKALKVDWSTDRNTKKYQSFENLPNKESIRRIKSKSHHGKSSLLVRFLKTQTGKDWNDIYSEIIKRLPKKIFYYKEIVFWFVADKVEIIDGVLYNKKTNKKIWTPDVKDNIYYEYFKFYVCPLSNNLLRINNTPSQKTTKKLNKGEHRKFIESRKNTKREYKEKRKKDNLEISIEVREILKKHNEESRTKDREKRSSL
jgi:hypothetical protein